MLGISISDPQVVFSIHPATFLASPAAEPCKDQPPTFPLTRPPQPVARTFLSAASRFVSTAFLRRSHVARVWHEMTTQSLFAAFRNNDYHD